MLWHAALMEKSVVLHLQETQFDNFIERVKTTDCQAELRRLLSTGPPVYVSDPNGLPLPDGEEYICKLWFHDEPTEEKSAKLKNAVEGEERQKLWDELKKFIITEGKEEGDDDEDVEGSGEKKME